MLQYFTNIWNAVVAFLASNGPMVCLVVVATAIVGAMVALYIDNLERTKQMLDSEDIGELASAMWEDYQRGHTLAVDTSIVGKDCPACHMFLEEGHVCVSEDEQLESGAQRWQESQAEQDYWQRRAAEGYSDCSPTCNCPECVGVEP